jgi:hypothetical protein
MLYRLKKVIWPPIPLYVGNYFFENTKHAQAEVNTLLSYHFEEERYKRHDPKNTVRENFNKIGLPWEYTTIFGRKKKCTRTPGLMMKSFSTCVATNREDCR